jgi:hypothetical protein
MRYATQLYTIFQYGFMMQWPFHLDAFTFRSKIANLNRIRNSLDVDSISTNKRRKWRHHIDITRREQSSSAISSDVGMANADFSDEEERLIESLYEKCQEAADDEAREAIILGTLPTFRPKVLMKLREAEQYTKNDVIRYVSQQLNKMLEKRLAMAKSTLEELMTAGEIRKLDNLIGSAARSGRLDAAFFNVLTLNLQEAIENAAVSENSEGDNETAVSRLQILKHVYTRCQEEVEKTIPPGTALLNKLLRTEQASIRSNLYEHYLTPRPNTITKPDGSVVTLNGTQSVLVSIREFVEAIDTAVIQIRDVENVGGTDRESAAMMVEGCRHIAKEARVVIGNAYGRDSDELTSLEEGLQPVFRPSNASSPYIAGSTS